MDSKMVRIWVLKPTAFSSKALVGRDTGNILSIPKKIQYGSLQKATSFRTLGYHGRSPIVQIGMHKSLVSWLPCVCAYWQYSRIFCTIFA